MNRIIFGAILGTAFIIGCASAATGPLVGTWELQLSAKALKKIDDDKKMGVPNAEAPFVTIDFKADGTYESTIKMGDESVTGGGDYELDGKELTLTTTMKNGLPYSAREVKVTLSDDMNSFETPDSRGMGKMVKK